MSTELIIVPQELEKAVSETRLATESAQSLRDSFAPHFVKFHELAKEAEAIAINAPKAARTMRLNLRAVRVAADKTRKELKEDSLRKGKAIDGINALLEYQLAPIEDRMEKIEKAEEIAAAERKAALKAERETAVAPYVQDVSVFMLAEMTPEAFAMFLDSQKKAHEERIAAAARAEAERIAKEKAEAEERARIHAENERLKKEATEREESQRQERLRQQALLEVERQKAAAEEARIKAEKAAARKAAAAPDKQKIAAFASAVRALPVPALGKEQAELQAKITAQVEKFAAWIDLEGAKL